MGQVRIPYGLLIRDRSSMASSGYAVTGGVIDAGYRGEIVVILTLTDKQLEDTNYFLIRKGQKIAQMIPLPVLTQGKVEVVEELSPAKRGENGFGSTGV
jgi:dUTP pyrophosphatase